VYAVFDAAGTLVGNAEIEIGDGVLAVRCDRAFVMSDRRIDLSLFEQQVPEIHQRGGVRGSRRERCREIGARTLAQAQADPRDAAFIEEERAFARGEILRCQQHVEFAFGAIELAAIERSERASKSRFIPKHGSSMFTIDVVTLFPELFAPFVGLSIVGRAVESGAVSVRYHHLLDELAAGERADDAPFGGGPGMVLRIEPIARTLDRIVGGAPRDERRSIVVPMPIGERFSHADAERWAKLDRLVVVCGHYEGIDDRLARLYPVEERSLGDFVLTGGEIPALAFMDATVRLLTGTLRPESLASESFAAGLLDYPSFTRPATFRGVDVPEVLLSGDHAKIAQWRREQSRSRTAARRRDLLDDPALQGPEAP
jgi:tRNA (guanine37-N1)-methyltransferase